MSRITIPYSLKKKLKRRAEEGGVSMSEVAHRFIKDSLKGVVGHCNMCEKKLAK